MSGYFAKKELPYLFKNYFSITVSIQYYISFKCTTEWLDIYIPNEVSPNKLLHLLLIIVKNLEATVGENS